MTLPLKLLRSAQQDLIEAQSWYEAQRPGLGVRFRSHVEEALSRIKDSAERYPLVTPRLRRILLRKPFPYSIYYSVHSDRVVVVACLHQKRDANRILSQR